MRAGDRLILATIALAIILTVLDSVSGGGVAGWANTHLSGWARTAGGWLMRIGLFVSPILLLPLLTALMGRFLSVPAGAWSFERRLIGIFDTITTTIGGAARWCSLGRPRPEWINSRRSSKPTRSRPIARKPCICEG